MAATVRQIALPNGVPNFRQSTNLDGTEFLFDFRWSQREQRYYVDVKDANGNLLVGCVKLVSNFPLLNSRRSFSASLPIGELALLDESAAPKDPQSLDLSRLFTFLYADAGAI
jgi:hypothetical protein